MSATSLLKAGGSAVGSLFGGKGGSSGGDGKSATTVVNNEPPAYVQAAQQNLLGAGQNMIQGFLNAPAFGTAGFNPDQQMGFDLTRDVAEGAFSAAPINMPAGTAGAYTPAQAAQMGAAAQSTGSQVTGEAIRGLLNPYTQSVVNTTSNELGRQRDMAMNQNSARSASGAAFGGSRQALRDTETERNYGETVAKTTAALMSQGWDRASATAQANSQLGQNNQQFNAGANNRVSEQNATFGQQANMRNAESADKMNQFNANLGMQMPLLQQNLAAARQQQQLQATGALMGAGNQQQQVMQQSIDLPWQMLDRLKSITPGTHGSTSNTKQPLQSNPYATAAGALQLANGAFGKGGLFGSGGSFSGGLGGLGGGSSSSDGFSDNDFTGGLNWSDANGWS